MFLLVPLEAVLDDISRPFTERLNLTKLTPHVDLVLFSFLFFTLAQNVIVPMTSKLVFPNYYGALKGRAARNKWATRGVSIIHAMLVLPLVFHRLDISQLNDDRAFGWDQRVGAPHAIAVAYFVWDTLDAIITFESIAFVLHGCACCLIYLFTFRPFLAYFGLRCLLWETSTIFLHIHWFFDKTGQTGSLGQYVNGAILLLTFFSIRIIWGGYTSYQFFLTLVEVKDQIPLFIRLLYCGGNILLQGLNWYWFFSMIKALQKRFRERDVGKEKVIDGSSLRKSN